MSTVNITNSDSRRASAVLLLSLTALTWYVYSLARMLVPSILPCLRREFNLETWQLGLTLTAFSLPYALMQLPSGVLSDRLGHKNLIVAGLVASSIGSLMMGIASNYRGVLFSRFITGLGQGTLFAPSMALLMEHFPQQHRGKSVSIYGVSINLGRICAPLLVGLLLRNYGWRAMFVMIAFSELIIASIFWRCIKEQRPYSRASASSLKSIKGLLSRTALALITLYLANIWVQTVTLFVPAYLVERIGMDVADANFTYSIIPITGLFSMLIAGLLSDRFSRGNVIVFFQLVNALLISLIAFSDTPSEASVLFVIYGILSAIPSVALFALYGDICPSEARGAAFGFLNLVGMLIGRSVAPLIIGYVIDLVGYKITLMMFPAVISVAGIIPFLLFSRSYVKG